MLISNDIKSYKYASDIDNACFICKKLYIIDDILKILPCKHNFHEDCTRQWVMNGSDNCPICRSNAL